MPKQPNVKSKIHAKDVDIAVVTYLNNEDYILLTDIARYRDEENPR